MESGIIISQLRDLLSKSDNWLQPSPAEAGYDWQASISA
jgi:hypothetical protein